MAFEHYMKEKELFKYSRHYLNTMNLWHREFFKYTDVMSNDQALMLIEDMEELATNVVSYDTYYKLLESRDVIPNKRFRADQFHTKNVTFLKRQGPGNPDSKRIIAQLKHINYNILLQ